MKNVRNTVPSILLIIVLVGFPQISESIFTPALPPISSSMHISAATSQLTMSIYFIAFAIGVLFWGKLSDQVGRRIAMNLGIIVYLIGNLGLFISPNFTFLLAARFIQALGASVGSVVTQTIMRESFSGLKGAKVFSKVSAAMALSPAFGPLIGGLIQSYLGYRNVFSALIIMATLILFYSYYRLPETSNKSNLVKVSMLQVTYNLLTDPIVWSYGLLIGGINGILFSYYSEAPFIFMKHFGYTSVQYGSLGMTLALASLLGALIVNFLVKYLKSEIIALIGLTFSSISGVLLLISLQLDQASLLILGFFLIFLGLNITLPVALNLALKGYEDVIGTASGLFSFGYYLIVSLLTLLVSLIHNGTIWTLPIFILIISLAMFFVYLPIVFKKNNKN
ncbi:Bcr/CflA family drug resistance efflux transporter [Companilactobacillus crustorum]|uniref:Bcr/CflA family efflux transporter n=3 Tax=Companilactobacillus TaxID=2767879 RepID=A0A837RFK1_9LACO|nr:multidrug effflux MFS transporter [Companilactobacillus crustorum]HCD07417.1 MFS transporter [Lactobacillus sp.]KRK41727.1 major facilitator superfamily permease [Companilactobacillus crustorum JCM 15951]KRO20485.1 major facilitator superfamily permease [Companilactobacillus crustorum]WDT66269.1 multidrug effflux MFS transporter [Companilactobacillus crustorum]GEO76966.1 Bcr/CflA family drug resistance efflux transporter [Companilactobacillus crustorum]